jgi:hypothetical protein
MRFLSASALNVWRLLAIVLRACVFIFAGIWFLLLGTICSSPNSPVRATGNTFSYSCHGSIVYITLIQHVLLVGLFPALVLAGLCGMAAKRRADRLLNGNRSESASIPGPESDVKR